MELTYTDLAMRDVGVLDFSYADFAWGEDENDFNVKLTDMSGVPDVNSYIYGDGEVGGVVRGYSLAADGALSLVGDTWSGILQKAVLRPPSNAMYFTASGEASHVVELVISAVGLSWLFSVNPTSGISISHTFMGRDDKAQDTSGRFMGAWSAIWQVCLEHELRISLKYDGELKKVVIDVAHLVDNTDEEAISVGASSIVYDTVKPTNHLVCLGQGEGTARTVVDLYMDKNGRVSQTKTISGIGEITEIYDNSGAKDTAKLISDGTNQLKEGFVAADTVKVEADANVSIDMWIGDYVGGADERTGVSAAAIVSKKILKVDHGIETVSYSTVVR